MFNERDDVDAREMREAIKELGGSRVIVHKLTLAPEINPADKKAFTREVMENLGRDMGRDLKWFAVEHNNTEHHHIHVVVLGKDSNGSDVRIDLKDIDKVKEYGDGYLERWHPRELERFRREREDREKERRRERTKGLEAAREERIREGLELPWMHKKIIREQLEPYKEWKEKQDQSAMLSALAEQMDNLEERIMAVLKATKEKAPPRILQSAEELKQVKEQLAAVERLTSKAARAAAKSQFLASMSVGFCADTAKLIVSGRTPEAGEKAESLAQTDAWAEGFAQEYLEQE